MASNHRISVEYAIKLAAWRSADPATRGECPVDPRSIHRGEPPRRYRYVPTKKGPKNG